MRYWIAIIPALSLLTATSAMAGEASRQENIGVGSGAVVGAMAGGPVGFVVGAAIGSTFGASRAGRLRPRTVLVLVACGLVPTGVPLLLR